MKSSDLKIVTDDTLKELRSLDIITPEIYTDTFKSKLRCLNNNIDLDLVQSDGILADLDKLTELQKKTYKNTQELKNSIDQATIAIEKKDNLALLAVREEINDLQQKIEELEDLIYIDDLTKVYNRKWLYDKALKNERFIDDGILTFIDLDKFKSINDNYGHNAGDKSLYLIATLLTKIEDAEVARLGGDEFLLLSKKSSIPIIENRLESINRSFEDKSLKYKEHTFKLSISYGSSNFKSGDDFNAINELVDSRMYENKMQRKQNELATA